MVQEFQVLPILPYYNQKEVALSQKVVLVENGMHELGKLTFDFNPYNQSMITMKNSLSKYIDQSNKICDLIQANLNENESTQIDDLNKNFCRELKNGKNIQKLCINLKK